MTPEEQRALQTAFSLLELGYSLDAILDSTLIPPDQKEYIRDRIQEDENITLSPARVIVESSNLPDWISLLDRSTWHYWLALRRYLLSSQRWTASALRSLDDSSDRILRQIAKPTSESFDVKGLVLGYVQSGKTANFSAVIAKAADAGYKLIIVLSGLDNGLRRQTNIRLKKELVGYSDGRLGSVMLPPPGLRWHEFTQETLHGDFRPGFANSAALQGAQPVLIVMKKYGRVLRRLLAWLNEAPSAVFRTLPFLLIDDEADQASVDTNDADEPPSVINGLIRELLNRFDKRTYIAYTATPFANILIPHDSEDPRVGNDLYPKDFIVDLPKPEGYFGAEEFFGRMGSAQDGGREGMNVVRFVNDEDFQAFAEGHLPPSLEIAMLDFVLAGAARAQRGHGSAPATMLIHTSHLTDVQNKMRLLVAGRFEEIRDEWRYQRNHGVLLRLRERWEAEFRPVTRAIHQQLDVTFEDIEPFVGLFFEAVQVREVNSAEGEVLDYERDPSLKAIAIGGNKLSRGLTLDGLLTSYFLRRSPNYDRLV
jgi:hypothetical protein